MTQGISRGYNCMNCTQKRVSAVKTFVGEVKKTPIV